MNMINLVWILAIAHGRLEQIKVDMVQTGGFEDIFDDSPVSHYYNWVVEFLIFGRGNLDLMP